MSILGNRVLPREDPKFLTTGGVYGDDLPLEGALWASFVRSPEEHARISATELPSFELVSMETPTPVNQLGAKGIGESGTIGSTPAIHNAVVDAVSHLGVKHIDMPLMPERVWAAVRQATT